MELRHIKETSCPICGCNVIESEEVEIDKFSNKLEIRRHTNGQQWEHRTFACGQRISWIPNASNSELSDFYICKQNPEYIKQQEKRKKAKEGVMQYIETLEDVDQEFKNRMLYEVKTIRA